MEAEDRQLLQKVFENSVATATTVNEMKQRLFGQTGSNGVIGDHENRIRKQETGSAKFAGALAVVGIAWEYIIHKILGVH